ncbi:hypothetical protein BDV12DRAFT_52654 [Aspergillus spectabilis]
MLCFNDLKLTLLFILVSLPSTPSPRMVLDVRFFIFFSPCSIPLPTFLAESYRRYGIDISQLPILFWRRVGSYSLVFLAWCLNFFAFISSNLPSYSYADRADGRTRASKQFVSTVYLLTRFPVVCLLSRYRAPSCLGIHERLTPKQKLQTPAPYFAYIMREGF